MGIDDMANVRFQRQDYLALRKQWDVIRDCLEGELSVKARSTTYLPQPNPSDTSEENQKRYENYLARAVFYNVTRRTVAGLVGLVFQREPIVSLPGPLKGLEDNADGGGVNLVQIAKDNLWNAVAYGKSGILVDYPHSDKTLTLADIQNGGFQPTLNTYLPFNIYNWRTAVIGGKRKITLVVLEEAEVLQSESDEFDMRTRAQFRVLRLRDGVYTQQLYLNNGVDPQPEFMPLDYQGKPFDEIPFFPIGSETNTLDPTPPPTYDLATINIAHYRNSADYEESCYIVGQPTLTLTGLTESWVKTVFNGNAVEMGSRAAIPLPEGGDAKILQAEPNSIVKEAMEAKEAQMVALGARLVQNKTSDKTATEARFDQSNADSVLASCAKNVNDGILTALEFAGRFAGSQGQKAEFKLNTEFDLTKLTAEEIKTVISAWQSNAITTSEMRSNLARGGLATLDAEKYKKEVAEDVAFAAENAGTMNEAVTPDPGGNA